MRTTTAILSIIVASFFIACGDNTDTPIVANITEIKIDQRTPVIYSTDAPIKLSATATYDDSTTKDITKHIEWLSSDYSAINIYYGELSGSGGNEEENNSTISIEYADLKDEVNVRFIPLESFSITPSDINTTGEHIIQATGVFADNTSKIIQKHIVWSATNEATITLDDNKTTLNIKQGETNVTVKVFTETQEVVYHID